MSDPSYIFDNAWREGRDRLAAVEEFLDADTFRVLEQAGVGEGWRCLEVGAGGGTVAAWLSRRVGPRGTVVATDIDTRYLVGEAAAPNIEVRRHDLVRDALAKRDFDLVHARLVLEHLPERDAALRKLVRALRPGGRLVVEAVDYVSAVPVSSLGAEEHRRSQDVRLRLFADAGARTDYGRCLPAAMRAEGLVEVANEGRVFVMEGGSAGARWFRLSMAQLRPRLTGPGKLTGTEIDRMLELFDDPAWAAISPIVFACCGRSPAV